MIEFGVFDTEDNSKELIDAGKSGFGKVVTQIAAIDCVTGKTFYNRGNIDQFKSWLIRGKEERGLRRWFAHNLQYDLGSLFADELDTLQMTMVGGRLIRAVWHGITFLDSFNLFPTSVKALGKALGFAKLKMDVHSKAYVFRDCEIVRRALTAMFEVTDMFEITRPAGTLGGLCVQIWQSMGGNNWPDFSHYSRAALFGGRVEIFAKGGRGRIVWVDINSLYPWAMTQKFPGPMKDTGGRMLKYGITTATVQIPDQAFAPLPMRVTEQHKLTGVSEKAVIFPCGRISGTWTNAELFHAVEKHGVKILKIHKSFGTSRGYSYYKKFCVDFYKRRLSEKSEAYKLVWKLFMNNLYGQLGMGGVITRSARLTPEIVQAARDGTRDVTIFGEACLFDTQIPLPEHVNYAHASYVTAYGRLRLLHYLGAVGEANVIYCDTDSVFFFWPHDKDLPFPTGGGLGEMKLEGIGRRMEVTLPKTYRLEVERKRKRREPGKRRFFWGKVFKAKGVPKKYARTFISEGRADYAAPFKIREAVRFYDAKVVAWKKSRSGAVTPVYAKVKGANARRLSVWRMVFKELRSSYHKKRTLKGGRFRPLILA